MTQDTSDVVVQARNVDGDIPNETRSLEAQTPSIASSVQGSTTYPYRTLLKDTSFPRCHLMARPDGRSEAYHGSLSMLGHGSPLWEPIGKLGRPKEHINSGVSIGDVGFLNSRGNFEYFFNIFLPPENAAQYHCPSDLIPLERPLESELSINTMHFPPGTALVSNGIEAVTISSSPLNIKFTVNAREGGILVLPDGASREDLLSTTRIRDYVQRNALNWYVFIKELLGDIVMHPNGTLYVITGTDKATTWATCVTHNRDTRLHQLWKPPTTTYHGAREDSVHRWQSDRKTGQGLAYQRSRPIEHVEKCALFIRGIRIAVSVHDWNKDLLNYNAPDVFPFSVIRTVPSLGLRAKIQILKECRPGYKQMVPLEGGTGVRVIFHPLDVILRLLLEESPSSSIAYIEDHIWCSVADKSDASLASFVRLLVQILETHETFVEGGVVTMLPRTATTQEQAASTPSSIWLRLPSYIKQEYRTMNQRRAFLNRLSKVFPGPRVAADLLKSTR